ncbi:MAG: LPP20 family lipoprotein [Motiliproteus sp.]
MMVKLISWVTALLAVALLSGCDTMQYYYDEAQEEQREEEAYSSVVPVQSQARIVKATGYAPISLQPGQTRDQKILMAMRVSKLQAYQELTAIVHGQHLFGTTQVREMVSQSDQFNTAVGGIIRGARVVKTYPVQNDTYATILELDLRDVQRAYVDMQ